MKGSSGFAIGFCLSMLFASLLFVGLIYSAAPSISAPIVYQASLKGEYSNPTTSSDVFFLSGNRLINCTFQEPLAAYQASQIPIGTNVTIIQYQVSSHANPTKTYCEVVSPSWVGP